MYDADAFHELTLRLAADVSGDADVVNRIQRLLERVTRLLGLRGSGLFLEQDDQLRCVAVTGTRIRTVQRLLRRTPVSLSGLALLADEPVVVPAGFLDGLPEHRRLAEQEGVHAILAVPLALEETVIGVVTLHAADARSWSAADRASAAALSQTLAAVVAMASGMLAQHRVSGQLQQALDSRVVLEQAKGVVAQTRGISPELAFEVIRRSARARRLSLQAAATEIVSRVEQGHDPLPKPLPGQRSGE